ncbi:PDZ domain-containing protein [Virgibacillus senegalensis]|uniref:PDZ domain-containing protein n=1 Tax=Virgibacillus senegalensis TaxID=1499679 RepID=UPI00069FD327|nr:PDZ domain-containing protein [Virgibacillus senegalensis]
MAMDAWLIELAKGVGRLFLNPLLYWSVILLLLASTRRIKQERTQFGLKVFDAFSEAKHTWSVSMIGGILLSAAFVGGGVVFSYPVVILLSIMMILLSITGRFTLLSAAYTFGFSYLILLIAPPLIEQYSDFSWTTDLQSLNFTGLAILLSAFLVIEAFLYLRISSRETYPELVKGSRGKWVGRHRLKKLAVIPFFTLVPAGMIEPFADWWPVLHIQGESFGLILLPLMTGLEQVVKGTKPVHAAKNIGRSVLVLAFLVLFFAIASYFVPFFSLGAFAVALIGREWITYRFREKEKQEQPFFHPSEKGLLILGIIPGTPADRLGMLVGERIERVNGQQIGNEKEFYSALQRNSAFCKLEVRDEQGELRFLQRAMYQGDPHELGILFAKEEYRLRQKEKTS